MAQQAQGHGALEGWEPVARQTIRETPTGPVGASHLPPPKAGGALTLARAVPSSPLL